MLKKTGIYLLQKWILVFLLFSSTLIFNPVISTDVYEFPKVLVLIIGVGLLTLLNIVDIYFRGLPVPSIKPIRPELFCLGILFFTQIIALLFSTDREISLMGTVPRYQGFLTNIHYLLLTLNTFYIFAKSKQIQNCNLSNWLSPILTIACLIAVLPYAFPSTYPFYFFTPKFFFNRVFGTFGNPNYLAIFIIGALPFLIYHKNLKKYILYPSVLLAIITLFLTGSRSAWVASILSFFLTGIILARKKSYKTLLITLLVILSTASIIGMKKYLAQVVPQVERFSLDSENSRSIQSRIYLWQAGLKMSLDRPFTGYGQDMIQDNIEPYLPEYLKYNDVFFIDRTHSEFIDILLTSGIFSLIFYLILISKTLKTNLTLISKTSTSPIIHGNLLSSFTALISIVIFHAVNFSITTSNILLYFLIAYLLALESRKTTTIDPLII